MNPAPAYTPSIFRQGRGRPRHCGAGEPAVQADELQRRLPGLSQFPAKGQARHLSVPIRRAVADGPVRLQAGPAGTSPRRESAGFDPQGQRLTGMTSGQTSFPVAPSIFKFAQHGKSGAWLSELLPHTAKIADDLCFIKSMNTEAINHDPAVTFIQTGSQSRPAQHRLVGRLRTGQRERGSAGVRGDDLAGQRESERSAAAYAAVGQRLSAVANIRA